MQQESAETHALSALAWLASEDDIFPVFLGASGASESDLRARASDAEFLASVLDFILMDDAWVLACSEAIAVAPDDIVRIRALLPGGDLPNWT